MLANRLPLHARLMTRRGCDVAICVTVPGTVIQPRGTILTHGVRGEVRVSSVARGVPGLHIRSQPCSPPRRDEVEAGGRRAVGPGEGSGLRVSAAPHPEERSEEGSTCPDDKIALWPSPGRRPAPRSLGRRSPPLPGRPPEPVDRGGGHVPKLGRLDRPRPDPEGLQEQHPAPLLADRQRGAQSRSGDRFWGSGCLAENSDTCRGQWIPRSLRDLGVGEGVQFPPALT
jgi:hypothetical protein